MTHHASDILRAAIFHLATDDSPATSDAIAALWRASYAAGLGACSGLAYLVRKDADGGLSAVLTLGRPLTAGKAKR